MSTSAPRTAIGRRGTRHAAAPPRRVSGPLRPAPAGARLGGAATAPAARPGISLPAPGVRVLDGLRALPDHRLTDRLVGGRAWIPVLGMLLIGIVTMQVFLLRLNSGIGRSVEKAAVLERENAALLASNGQLSSGERVRAAALRAGLVDPVAGSVRFLRAGRADPAQAVRTIKPPGQGAAATAAAAAATAATTSTTTPSAVTIPATPYATSPTVTTPTTTTPAPTTTTPTTTTTLTTPTTATTTTTPTTTATPTTATTAGPTAVTGAAAPGVGTP